MNEQINRILLSASFDQKMWSNSVMRMHLYIIEAYLDRTGYSLDSKIRVIERMMQLAQPPKPQEKI